MMRRDTLQIRIGPGLRQRLDRLRSQHHVNVSSWARQTLADALDRDFPPPAAPPGAEDPPAPAAPIPGWRPCRRDSGWGSALEGPAADSLPDNLAGSPITVTDSKGFSWTATVSAVVERSPGRITVTDSGRPRKPS